MWVEVSGLAEVQFSLAQNIRLSNLYSELGTLSNLLHREHLKSQHRFPTLLESLV